MIGQYGAAKFGSTHVLNFTASGVTTFQILGDQLGAPVLLGIRTSQPCYLRQGDSTVTATVNDFVLRAGIVWPLLVEGLSDNYIAVRGGGTAGQLFCTIMSSKSDYMDLGIFAGGIDSTGVIATVQIYTFALATLTLSPASLTQSRAASMSCGNVSVGICTGGSNLDGSVLYTSTEKYTYFLKTWSAGTALGAEKYQGVGGGLYNTGFMTGGLTTAGADDTSTVKYTYATDTVAAGTALSSSMNSPSGTCDRTALYITGSPGAGSNRKSYTFATDVVADTTAASVTRLFAASVGNTTAVVTAGGLETSGFTVVASSDKFTISGATNAAGGNLITARDFHNGISDAGAGFGIFSGGFASDNTTLLSSQESYTIATNITAAVISLSSATRYRNDDGISNCHGGL